MSPTPPFSAPTAPQAARQWILLKLIAKIKSPFAIVLALIAATLSGVFYPEGSTILLPLSAVYLALMKMIFLPFVLAGIMGGIGSLLSADQGLAQLTKIAVTFLALSLASLLLAAFAAGILPPTGTMNDDKMRDFGKLLNKGDGAMAGEIAITLKAAAPEAANSTVSSTQMLAEKFIPGNIFSALTSGDTLKVLAFAMIFGVALSRVEKEERLLTSILKALETSCITLMGWFNFLLPFALFAMIYHLVASIGIDVFFLMSSFLLTLTCAGLLFILLAAGVIYFSLGRSWADTMLILRTPLIMGAGTQNAMLTIPMVLHNFAETRVRIKNADLVYPIGLSLCRFGSNIFYVIATVFVAQVYAHDISLGMWAGILAFSMLAGLAATGASGILMVSMLSLVCTPLHLPVEAAVVLFLAVEPISDALRTTLNVAGNLAAAAAAAGSEEGTA